ncbi:MAG: [FeFe] hydrogenase H-cluster maturation GTPase HydF [Planctomycetaceae bacterium]|jgi:[FeFe] hydrogenase H-cluster maturation GTPase HydF|nr:[FeFe] hydrogenase H-cluster maturation GTPase HydF [Planctomycetaceae bacterium]
MQTTPKGFRLHLGIFGRRNVGKSSLLNALTHQATSIVSDAAGTTTDPVEKPMELLPIGPVLWIDTAGIDDEGALGELRIQKTKSVLDRTEIGIIVSTADAPITQFEQDLINAFRNRSVPIIYVFNKIDTAQPRQETLDELKELKIPYAMTDAISGRGIIDLHEIILKHIPDDFLTPPPILVDLVPSDSMVVLVVPVDKEAPKGRLILPQVQAIREVLDAHLSCVVVQDEQLSDVLNRISPPPALVVTDSQAFAKVSKDVPLSIPLTSFSILFARQKADLGIMIEGAKAIKNLKIGSRIVIAESCTHHPIEEDIGTIKIPKLLRQFVGGELEFKHLRGHEFLTNDLNCDLVIHCGACMWNRREMLSRIMYCQNANIPITNYGLAIAFTLGIFDRAIKPIIDAKNYNYSVE